MSRINKLSKSFRSTVEWAADSSHYIVVAVPDTGSALDTDLELDRDSGFDRDSGLDMDSALGMDLCKVNTGSCMRNGNSDWAEYKLLPVVH